MMTSPIYGFPELTGTTSERVNTNLTFRYIESLFGSAPTGVNVFTPPTAPTDGSVYLVNSGGLGNPTPPTGIWSGKSGQVGVYTSSGWFYTNKHPNYTYVSDVWSVGGLGTTNLSVGNRTSTTLDVVNSAGIDATIPPANSTEAGLLTSAKSLRVDSLNNLGTFPGTVIRNSATLEEALTDLEFAIDIGGGGVGTRATATVTTASLANNAEEQLNITLSKGYHILSINCSLNARVRVYQTAAKRTSDAGRSSATAPTGNHGVVFEFLGSGTFAAQNSPVGFNLESVPTSAIPISVQNLSGSTTTITVTIIYLAIE